MKPVLDETHQPTTQSWVESANDGSTDFPIQNLPFGVFRRKETEARIGVAIGESLLDITGLAHENLLNDAAAKACTSGSLNNLMSLGNAPRQALRKKLHALLRLDTTKKMQQKITRHLIPQSDAEMLMPADVGDYTDFYASVFHATNVGRLFRPDNPLLANYKHIPIGYHGRASSLVVSGTQIQRPQGQTRSGDAAPVFGPCKSLDYELELGFFVGTGNTLGKPIPIGAAEDHIFGLCLVNDWSARDMQAWEYQPLGPFLAKSFSTSLSPWVVTMEALTPFRTPAFTRPKDDPHPLAYLIDQDNQQYGGITLNLEVLLSSKLMRDSGMPAMRLSQGNFKDMYWTIAQMLAHHASNGCNMRPGDLLASGTVSGPEETMRGCLLEITSGGKNPITLPTGEQRKFLEDSDEVTLHGFCARDGFRAIGFGTCRGVISG